MALRVRALLQLEQRELTELADLHVSTLVRMEAEGWEVVPGNLCALSGTVTYARCNNNSDHSPQRRDGFAQHDASPQSSSTLLYIVPAFFSSSGSLAMFAAIRRASSHLVSLVALVFVIAVA